MKPQRKPWEVFKWGSDEMLLVFTSLWLPCDAWSGSPERVISPPSSFFVHSHTSGSRISQAMKSHLEGMTVERGRRESEHNNQREKASPWRSSKDALTVPTRRKWEKQGAHYRQEHVYAFINISNVDLIFRVHPASTQPGAFHLTSR